MENEVLVCLADLAWTANGPPENDERHWFYVEKGKNVSYSNRECTTLREIAKELVDCKIIYEPPVEAEILFVDGYFGRPATPSIAFIT